MHTQAIWIFGVIVGLALREALLRVVPHFVGGPENASISGPEAWRLFVFLLLIVRFYLGSVHYFKETQHAQNDARFLGDLLFGVFHFLVFFALALTLPIQSASPRLLADGQPITFFSEGKPLTLDSPSQAQGVFYLLIMVILAYDTLWAVMSKWLYRSVPDPVRFWAFINIFTLLLMFVTKAALSSRTPLVAESVALGWVVVVSMADLADLITGKTRILNLFCSVLPAGVRERLTNRSEDPSA